MTKFSMVLLVVVFGSAAAYAVFAAWQFKQDKLKYIHQVNSTFTQTIGQKLQDDLEVVTKDIHNILEVFVSHTNDVKNTDLLIALFKNNPMLISLNVFRRTGPTFGTEYSIFNSDWGSIHQVPATDMTLMSEVELRRYISSKTNKKNYFFDRFDKNILVYVYPLSTTHNLFAVFGVSKDFLNLQLANSEVSDLKLVKNDGAILSAKFIESAGSSVKTSVLFQQAITSQVNEGSMEFSVRDGRAREDFIGSFMKLSDDLILIGEISKTEAFSGLNRILLTTILFGLMVAALSIVLGVLFSRTITLPLNKLMLATEDIAAGRFDVVPVISTQDEVGQLADYFTILGQRLSEREEQLEKAIDLANKDGMTGLFNHRHFRARFAEFFNLAKRHGKPLSLILTDIDHFKKFNDTYGHQQGDQVIKDMAKILSVNARDTDLVARYGGEEFVIVLPETDAVGAAYVAEKMRKAYQDHQIVNINDGSFITSTCSLGVSALVGDNFKNIDEMIEQADQNLYRAKKDGRNQVAA